MASNQLPRSYPRVNLQVTQQDIDGAVRSDSSHCVIADAIRRELGATRVEVDLQLITFTDPDRNLRVSYLTPEVCQRHLLAFDQGWEVEPFDFYLRAPIRIRRAGRGAGHAQLPKATRAERLAELEAKETAGTQTPADKRSLAKMRATDSAAADLGPVTREEVLPGKSDSERPVIVGGSRPVASPAVLSNAKGRRRYFGARLAKPGVSASPATSVTPTE